MGEGSLHGAADARKIRTSALDGEQKVWGGPKRFDHQERD